MAVQYHISMCDGIYFEPNSLQDNATPVRNLIKPSLREIVEHLSLAGLNNSGHLLTSQLRHDVVRPGSPLALTAGTVGLIEDIHLNRIDVDTGNLEFEILFGSITHVEFAASTGDGDLYDMAALNTYLRNKMFTRINIDEGATCNLYYRILKL